MLLRSRLLVIGLLISSIWSCNNNDISFVQGDISALKLSLDSCFVLADTSTTADFERISIDAFQHKLNVIDSCLADNLSEQEVKNLTVHLSEAKKRFLQSKLIGIPTEALIAGWGFDEGQGTELVSDGVRKLTAVLMPGPAQIFTTSNLPKFVDGFQGKALEFDKGAHLEVPNYASADFLGQLSISVWLKPKVMKGGNYVASLNYWNNWKFQIQENNKAFFTYKSTRGHVDADNEYDNSVPMDRWTHVVVSLDTKDKLLSFYINGRLTKEWNVTGKPNLDGSQDAPYSSKLGVQLPLMIGAATTYEEALAAWDWQGWNTPSSWDHFQGAMDDIRFYNIALKEGQVKKMYLSYTE